MSCWTLCRLRHVPSALATMTLAESHIRIPVEARELKWGHRFLNNIDDIASDLGFLGGVWDDQRVGVFYDALDKDWNFASDTTK
eukprot:6263319-Amphidinium_carterae.1